MGKYSQKFILLCRMTERSLLTNYFDTSCWLGATITMSLPNTTSFVLPHHSFKGKIMLELTINYQKKKDYHKFPQYYSMSFALKAIILQW